jgi:gliding motility-associated protein GldL
MSQRKGFLESLLFKKLMAKVYGLGAAVVIVGAWAKILHLKIADVMLTVGLLTEALIFIISAFEPVHDDVDWSRVYPELSEDYDVSKLEAKKKGTVSQQLDKMLEEAKVSPDLISSLGSGLQSLSSNVSNLTDLSKASVATNEYVSNVQKASKSIEGINTSYVNAVDALNNLASAGSNTKEYQAQMDKIAKNLSSLNSIYELEIAESNNHLKTISSFVGNLSKVVSNLSETEQHAVTFKQEMDKLSKNLSTLNNVYGGMLSAMNVARPSNNNG